ncbi:organic hydroperoxide resistance protein [Diaporthe eres]|uniref:Organic hydroperoxide resistance protein n=1 Tax=Diaporthe vaccinii TaxID=105482 RepID=A0ABR4EWP2_9PEZI|nr:organic hydroperoxide resistance protein [Diaporthe eres]
MSSYLRAVRPLARQVGAARYAHPSAPSTALTPVFQHQQRRLLDTSSAPTLYSAHARVIGARTGRVQGENLNVELTMAKALGGPGDRGKTNPEELFAAGYGACFQSAMNAAAAGMGVKMPSRQEDSVVESTVHLVGDMKGLDMGLKVNMVVKVKGLGRAELEKVVRKAEEVCPYSRATRGNVDTHIKVVDFTDGESDIEGGEPKSYGTSTYG